MFELGLFSKKSFIKFSLEIWEGKLEFYEENLLIFRDWIPSDWLNAKKFSNRGLLKLDELKAERGYYRFVVLYGKNYYSSTRLPVDILES